MSLYVSKDWRLYLASILCLGLEWTASESLGGQRLDELGTEDGRWLTVAGICWRLAHFY